MSTPHFVCGSGARCTIAVLDQPLSRQLEKYRVRMKGCSLRNAPPHLPPSRTAYTYSPEAQLYGQSSGAAYFDTQAGGGQATAVVSSTSSGPPHSMVGVAMDSGGGQILSGGGAYLIHGGSLDGGHHRSSLSSSAMVRPSISFLELL